MDVRQLRYFVGVLEAKSLSKASGMLHVAQPALGVQIRNLERELGTKLLRRHPRGVVPTEAGERLAQHAGQLLRQFDRVRQDLVNFATTPNGRVSLTVSRSLPQIVTASITERCRKIFPDIQLRVVESGHKQQLPQSEQADSDLVITFRPHHDQYQVAEPLVQDEMVLVCSAKGPRLPCEIDFSTAMERPLILPSEQRCMREIVESAARSAGHELKLYCDIDSIPITKELVSRGAADTLLPIANVRDDVADGKLQMVKIKNRRLQRTLYMLHSAKQSRSSAVDLVRREIRTVITEFAGDRSFGWQLI